MIKINDLYKNYNAQNGEIVKALQGINIDISSKGLVCIVGKSGSGKSTLLQLLGGVDFATYGEISSFDLLAHRENQNEYRTSLISFVFQDFHLIKELNVYDNIAIASEIKGVKTTPELVSIALAKVELKGYEQRQINELSGGQKQRIAIARAIMCNTPILLADEPTGSLDYQTGEQIWKLFETIAKEKLVIIITHDLISAEKYATRLLQIEDGKIIADKSKVFNEQEENRKKQLLKIEDYLLGSDVLTPNQKTKLNYFMNYIDSKSEKGDTLFEDTIKENITTVEDTAVTIKKPKLSFLYTLKMGINGLQYKKSRLIISSIITIFSLLLLYVVSLSFSFSIYKSEVSKLSKLGTRNVLLNSNYNNKDGILANSSVRFDDQTIQGIDAIFSSPSLQAVHHINQNSNLLLGLSNYVYPIASEFSDYYYVKYNPYYLEGITHFYELENGLPANYKLLEGSLPVDYNEIVITDYTASVFINYGYNEIDGSYTFITANSQLIGKKLNIYEYGDLTISGIIQTDISLKSIAKYKDNPDIIDTYFDLSRSGILSSAFVKKGFNDEYNKSFILNANSNLLTLTSSLTAPLKLNLFAKQRVSTEIVFINGHTDFIEEGIILDYSLFLEDKETFEMVLHKFTWGDNQYVTVSYLDKTYNLEVIGLTYRGGYQMMLSNKVYSELQEMYNNSRQVAVTNAYFEGNKYTAINPNTGNPTDTPLYPLVPDSNPLKQLFRAPLFNTYDASLNITLFAGYTEIGENQIVIYDDPTDDSTIGTPVEPFVSQFVNRIYDIGYIDLETYTGIKRFEVVGKTSIPTFVVSNTDYSSLTFHTSSPFTLLNFLTNNQNKNIEILTKLDRYNDVTSFSNYNIVVNRNSLFTAELEILAELVDSLQFPGLIATIVFLLISLFLMFNFITVNVMIRFKEIGIIKTFGAGIRQISGIFITEVVILMTGILLIVLGLSVAGISVVNNVLDWNILFISIPTYLLIFLAAQIAALVCSILPILSVSHLEPLTVIKRNAD